MEYGIREARREQMVAQEYYVTMLERDEQMTTMNIKELRANTEPMEKLDDVSLHEEHSDKIACIGTQASPLIQNGFILFLKNNLDIFA